LRERVSNASPPPPDRGSTTPVQAVPLEPLEPDHSPSARAHDAPPPPPKELAPLERRRQGFYLRGALGFGFRSDSISGDNAGSASLSGAGLAIDIAAGYAVLPGFVVGGGIFVDTTFGPKLSGNGANFKLTHANLWTVGPFVDWYPKRETTGWHIEGALGIGVLSYGNATDSQSASGLDLMLGGGYEWSLSGAYALGVLVRFTLGLLAEDIASHGFVSPSLGVSFSWF